MEVNFTTDQQPESTVDSEPVSSMKPELDQMPEVIFVLEPEPIMESVQVREPAPVSIPEGVLVEFECMEWSPAHTPTTEGVLCLVHKEWYDDSDDVIP